MNFEDKGEIDTDAFKYDEGRKIYNMQIAKLRNSNKPDKKKVSAPRQNIPLDSNEFLTLFYDKKFSLSIVQINRNSLSSKELDIYLTQLRNYVRRLQGKGNDEFYIESRIVPDDEKWNMIIGKMLV